MSEIVPPCDCIELVDGKYTYGCQCSNRGDGERAAVWCVEANYKASAEYDKCTIEFLRKEAAEAADEITRLRAALEWALERCMESDHPHYPFREDGVWKFPYQVSGAGGSGGGVGEQRFATALEAVEAAIRALKGKA